MPRFLLRGQSTFGPVPFGIGERRQEQGVVDGLPGVPGHVLFDQLGRLALVSGEQALVVGDVGGKHVGI
jgi:hypothetical protein